MLLEFVHAKFGAQAYRTKIGYRINFDTWLAMDSSYCSQIAAVCIHSCIRGHHIYKDILATSCGERLECTQNMKRDMTILLTEVNADLLKKTAIQLSRWSTVCLKILYLWQCSNHRMRCSTAHSDSMHWKCTQVSGLFEHWGAIEHLCSGLKKYIHHHRVATHQFEWEQECHSQVSWFYK